VIARAFAAAVLGRLIVPGIVIGIATGAYARTDLVQNGDFGLSAGQTISCQMA